MVSERIDIAIDPFTGRNPSYCFVDLESKELADRAMVELDGRDMLGRPIKIKPGVAKNSAERIQQRVEGLPNRDKASPVGTDRWRRNDASSFGKMNSDSSRRLYVGGLPKLVDQDIMNSGVTQFFQGYNVYVVSPAYWRSECKADLSAGRENISKQFPPHPAKRFQPGDHYYLFVDLGSVEEAQAAMDALNGKEGPWGASLRVQRARGETWKSEDRGKVASTRATEVAESAGE